jgi:heme exporter protein A
VTERRVLLSADGLCVERGGRELFRDLSFQLSPGDFVHLRGPNGAGKTTLLRILAGLSRFSYQGALHRPVPCLYLGHQSAVKSLLSARENLAWHPAGEDSGSVEQIDAALAAVGLYGYEDVPVARMSAGQQRRVNLARLFLSERPLWLLDEPLTAIDTDGSAALIDRLRQHARRGGAVLLTSHQALSDVEELRCIDLSEGGEP